MFFIYMALCKISQHAGFYGKKILDPPNPQKMEDHPLLPVMIAYSMCLQLHSIYGSLLLHMQPEEMRPTTRGLFAQYSTK
jgi:hypothetical protein